VSTLRTQGMGIFTAPPTNSVTDVPTLSGPLHLGARRPVPLIGRVPAAGLQVPGLMAVRASRTSAFTVTEG
jgi:hypothetical protein